MIRRYGEIRRCAIIDKNIRCDNVLICSPWGWVSHCDLVGSKLQSKAIIWGLVLPAVFLAPRSIGLEEYGGIKCHLDAQ